MNNEDAIIDDLILQGALEVAGIDSKTGEFLFSVTPKLQEIMPDLYEEHLNSVNQGIMALWEMDLLILILMKTILSLDYLLKHMMMMRLKPFQKTFSGL